MGIWRSVERRRVVLAVCFRVGQGRRRCSGLAGRRRMAVRRRGEVRDWLRGSVSARRDGRRRKLSSAGGG